MNKLVYLFYLHHQLVQSSSLINSLPLQTATDETFNMDGYLESLHIPTPPSTLHLSNPAYRSHMTRGYLTEQIETSQIETSQIETSQIETSQIETSQIENSQPLNLSLKTSDHLHCTPQPIEIIETSRNQQEEIEGGDAIRSGSNPIDIPRDRLKYNSSTSPGTRNPKRKRTFPCKYCQKVLSSRYSCISHERSHTGEKPFKCKDCNFSGKSEASLKYHIEIHHAVNKRYACLDCGKFFGSSSNLKLHNQCHHKIK